MHKHEMEEILFELKTELENNQQMEQHHRQITEALVEKIEELLGDPQANMSGDTFLLTRLKESAEEFEANHPKLTNVIGRLSDLLARMGI